jgi:unsaturated rhamnogalacturonyl hydrolase
MADAVAIIAESERAIAQGPRSPGPRGRQFAHYCRRVLSLGDRFVAQFDGDPVWPAGLHALALVRAHERFGSASLLAAIERFCDSRIDADGRWRAPPERVAHALPAYAALYLHRTMPASRWARAVQQMAAFLVHGYPREADGSLRYVPQRPEILVDTLGMVCPFLAAFGRDFDDTDACEVAKRQFVAFNAVNRDPDSRLVFHGYRVGGPYRLGLHGWGRGVGWYLLGLVDTLVELSPGPDPKLVFALHEAVEALRKFQRPDGHWSWVVPFPDQMRDSSVTAMCGYALARAAKARLLNVDDVSSLLDSARTAILAVTDSRGVIGDASGECAGLGVYSMRFGPQPWAQAASAAFLAQWPIDAANSL